MRTMSRESRSGGVMRGIPLVRHRIVVCMRRQRLVECRIENRNVRHGRKPGACDFNPHDVGGIVQWRQRDELTNARNDGVVDDGRCTEHVATVYDAMADTAELGFIDDRMAPIHARHQIEPLAVIGQRPRTVLFVEGPAWPAPALSEMALGATDVLDQTAASLTRSPILKRSFVQYFGRLHRASRTDRIDRRSARG